MIIMFSYYVNDIFGQMIIVFAKNNESYFKGKAIFISSCIFIFLYIYIYTCMYVFIYIYTCIEVVIVVVYAHRWLKKRSVRVLLRDSWPNYRIIDFLTHRRLRCHHRKDYSHTTAYGFSYLALQPPSPSSPPITNSFFHLFNVKLRIIIISSFFFLI